MKGGCYNLLPLYQKANQILICGWDHLRAGDSEQSWQGEPGRQRQGSEAGDAARPEAELARGTGSSSFAGSAASLRGWLSH